jgi:hypothetical protein
MSVDFDFETTDDGSPPAPMGSASFRFPAEFRLGGGGAESCSPEQLSSNEEGCPEDSQLATGSLALIVPGGADPDEGGTRFVSVRLTGFNAPGGGAINVVARSDYPPIRTIFPALLDSSGQILTMVWPDELSHPGGGGNAQLVSLEFNVGLLGESGKSWVGAAACSGSWEFGALVGSGDQAYGVSGSAPCETAAPPRVRRELESPDLRELPARGGGGRREGGGGVCRSAGAGVQCGAGNGRRTSGGGGKVSHSGWPAVTGALEIADNAGRSTGGSPLNDELLGGDGSDHLSGGAGNDILWGDQHPVGNNVKQHDTELGGPGNDWIYTSHGTNNVDAGPGRDLVFAYYGHGTIDCGGGSDTLLVRSSVHRYSVRSCEHRRGF